MQIAVIFLTMPWIIILSKNQHFTWIRIGGSIFAMIAALAWMTERFLIKPNIVSISVENMLKHGKWIVLSLMIMAALSTILENYRLNKKPINHKS